MTNPRLAQIAAHIHASQPPTGMTTKLIGIDGCGGAGKTTLAKRLADALHAQLIHTDDFASWDNPLDWHDRLMTQVIAPPTRKSPSPLSALRLDDTGACRMA